MTCHSFYCFSIVWGQGNAPLVTFLPNSCYICSEVVEGVRESLGILRQRGDLLTVCYHPRGGGGGYSLIWPIRGCAAGQGMVFVLSVLKRVYNFARLS